MKLLRSLVAILALSLVACAPMPTHRPRDMPVWGWQFYRSEEPNDPAERARVDALIERLVQYLRSIQKS